MRIDDGFKTLISFANGPTLEFYEKEVTPPGIDGGGPIDTTTMRNDEWRTMSPKQLKTLTEMSVVVAYATDLYQDIRAQINDNQIITIVFPDNSELQFWGWLNSFTPGALVEGEQPTATLSVHPSNHNDGNPPVEVDPIYTEATSGS